MVWNLSGTWLDRSWLFRDDTVMGATANSRKSVTVNGTKNGGTSRPLEFKAYIRDPLARLVLGSSSQRPWKFPVIYAAMSIVFLGLAMLVYVLRDGGLDVSRFGGYQAMIPTLTYNLVLYAFGGHFYLYFSLKSGTLYQDLADEGVIRQLDLSDSEDKGEVPPSYMSTLSSMSNPCVYY